MALRDWIRRTFFQGFSAGTFDTLSALQGRDTTSLPIEQAVAEFVALMGSAAATPVIAAAKEPSSGQQPLPLAAPRENDHVEQPEPPRRGPGRPRKFQNPPEPQE
jgi:hypothetical protein